MSIGLRLGAVVFTAITATALSVNAQQTATPIFTPGAGAYAAGQMVTIADAMPGAVIYYGIHGVIPTTSSPVYTGPIPVSGTETVRAIAVAPGHTESAIASATYTALPKPTGTPVFKEPAGAYPAGQAFAITDSTPGATIYYAVHGAIPTTSSTKYTGPIPVSGTETIKAIAVAANYGVSAVASVTYTSLPAAMAPVFSPGPGTYAIGQKVTITDKTAGTSIYYSTDGTIPTAASKLYSAPVSLSPSESLSAIAVSDSASPSSVTTAVYGLFTAAPTFSSPSTISQAAKHITITDATPGAVIYFTTDGSAPSTASTLYTGAVTIPESQVLNAIAVAPKYAPSSVTSATYIVETIFTIAGKMNSAWGTYTGDGGPAYDAGLNEAEAIVFDAEGNLYIADRDNEVVRKVSGTTGIITTFAGNGQHTYLTDIGTLYGTYSGDEGAATSAGLSGPYGLAFDSHGNLFIAEYWNNRVRKVAAATGIITTVAGNGDNSNTVAGAPGSFSGDGGPATSAELNHPAALAFDSHDNLFIADSANNVVREVSAATGIITTVAGIPGDGLANGLADGDGGQATAAHVGDPASLAFDSAGNLYVAQTEANAIRKIDMSSGTITRYAGLPYQTQGNLNSAGPATSAYIPDPTSIAFDAGDNLYIGEYLDGRIRVVSATDGNIATIAGNGSCSNGVDEGVSALMSPICGPQGVALDAAGNLYIAEAYRLRKVSLSAAPAPQF